MSAVAANHTFFDRVTTWWIILRIALEERLAYRGDFAIGTFMRFLPIVTQIFLWWAIFDSLAADGAKTATLVGYSFPDMVAYYLLTMVTRAFSSMPGHASNIARQIREGEIKKYLIQPVDLIGFLLLGRIAHKLAYYTIATGPFALLFFLCRDYFQVGWLGIDAIAIFVASLLLSFALGFFLETCIGLIGFWLLEVTSLLFIYMLFSFFLSGHMFPLDMLPAPFDSVVDFLPLKYLAYFPAAVLLGKVTGYELYLGFAVEIFWVVFFVLLARWMYSRGLKRYSGYGG